MFCPQHNLTTLTLTTLVHGATLSHVCFNTSSHIIHSSFLTLPHSHLLKHQLLLTAPLCLEVDDDKESSWLSNSDLLLADCMILVPSFFFPWPDGMWDLSSRTRDQTHTHCIGIMASKPLDHQGSSDCMIVGQSFSLTETKVFINSVDHNNLCSNLQWGIYYISLPTSTTISAI